MLVAFIAGEYSPIRLGWIARISGNPWISDYGSVLDCQTRDDLEKLGFRNRKSERFTIWDTALPFREALRYMQGLDPLDVVVKSLTTSQTFNTGMTAPVESTEVETITGYSATPMPIAAFLEPWVIPQKSESLRALRLSEYLERMRDLQRSNKARYKAYGKLVELACRQNSPPSGLKGMGRFPCFFFNIADQPLNIPAPELQRLEAAAYDLFAGFSQFAQLWRICNGDFDQALKTFEFDPSKGARTLETYMVAVDFMKDEKGRWKITDVGGLGGGAIADITFCNKVKNIYPDPADAMAAALETYGTNPLRLVPPAFGMNVWEAEQIRKALQSRDVALAADSERGLDLLLSVKPKPSEVENPLPTKEFSRLYQVPLRTYVLQALGPVLERKYNVGVPEVVALDKLVDREGKDGALEWLRENFGNWMIYRGRKFRTGPILIGDVAANILDQPAGVVLEKLCPPWLPMTKRTLYGDLSGKYAAELRIYLAVKKND